MSDSDNEFGSLAPTTPLVPVRKRSRTAESRPAIAGPSKLAKKQGRKGLKNVNKAVVEDVDIHALTDVDGEDDEIVTTKELERLRSRLNDAETHRDSLSRQLEDLFRVRNTVTEKLLEEQTKQYDARIQTQEALIHELTAQAARVEPLTRSGKGSILHLVTREAADEEKRTVERDLARWQGLAKEKDDIITQNKRQIAELQQSVNDLRTELQAEIDRNRQLTIASRKPAQSSQLHSAVVGIDNPKNTEVIKLYEDLTNFLISNLRFTPGENGSEELHFTCYYTHVDPTAAPLEEKLPDEGKSLSFNLRFFNDEDEGATQPKQMIQYTPQHLDHESAEFTQQLDFLSTSFIFERDQLPMFLSTLQKNTASTGTETEDDENDGKMEI